MALRVLAVQEVRKKIEERFPNTVVGAEGINLVIKSEAVLDVMRFLKETPELGFDYFTSVTAVDYLEFFEVVYHLTSMENRQTLVLKTRCYDREKPQIPSVTPLWQGADLQEREVYDLMGIRFQGHPNLKRIFMWEGFEGHPLRKDFL